MNTEHIEFSAIGSEGAEAAATQASLEGEVELGGSAAVAEDAEPELEDVKKKSVREKSEKPKRARSKKDGPHIIVVEERKPSVKASAERSGPVSGQSAPKRDIPYEDLNEQERSVVRAIVEGTTGRRKSGSIVIKDIEKATELTNLQVRNSLRKAVVGGWVQNVGRGQYAAADKELPRKGRAKKKAS